MLRLVMRNLHYRYISFKRITHERAYERYVTFAPTLFPPKVSFFSYVELYVFLVQTERNKMYLAEIGFKLVPSKLRYFQVSLLIALI